MIPNLQTLPVPDLGLTRKQTANGDIVCACSGITRDDIRQVVQNMDNAVRITPGAVYRALGKRPQCGACFSAFDTLLPGAKAGPPLGLLSPIPDAA